ncbi:MAG: hypothetical protein ACRERV_02545 [Methylococcales bacterium]
MSFDLYLQVFENGRAVGVAPEIIRATFGQYLIEVEEDFWQVQYDVDESSDLFLQPAPGDATLIHSLSIHRPCRDIRLWEAVWRLLKMSGSIFYFPGCNAPLARDPMASLAMPSEMRKSLGDPVIVHSAQEIFESFESL